MYQLAYRLALFGHLLFFSGVLGHGRLIEPPSRGSMWRYGFETPHDYNDHESYCGGFNRQWNRNKGKCGICGDPWDVKKLPRPHEAGGEFAKGIIVRKYSPGSEIDVRVELTANHQGYFEFRLCPVTHPGVEVDQDCLDRHVLIGENGARYYPGPGNKIFETHYKLPDGLTCEQCVLQWRYIAGNNWNMCENGTGAVGCGPQEEFRACADIAIGYGEISPPRTIVPKTDATPNGTTVTKHIDTSPTEPSSAEPEETGTYWLFSLLIAVTCLLVILAILALIYVYYYHAGKAKQWLMAGQLLTPESPPTAPPRHKRNQNSISQSPLEV